MLPEWEGAGCGQNKGDRGGGENTGETVPRQVCVHGAHGTVSTCLELSKHQKSPKTQKQTNNLIYEDTNSSLPGNHQNTEETLK